MKQACEKAPSLRWWTGPAPYAWAFCLVAVYSFLESIQ